MPRLVLLAALWVHLFVTAAGSPEVDPKDWRDVAAALVTGAAAELLPLGPPAPLAACDRWLDAAEVQRQPANLPVHQRRGSTITCGAAQTVRYRRGPGRIRWRGSPIVTCDLALAMARLEEVVQEEAHRHLGTRVVRIRHLGTYNCREMAAYPGWTSEHAYANAIDVAAFELRDGRTIPVSGHYGDGRSETRDRATAFVRAVAQRAFDEDVFATVLTPAFDRLHRNHLHLDMAPYRVDGTR